MSKFLFLICTLALLGLRATPAATFNIPNGDVAALKNAIAAANSNGQADVINLATGGLYTLTTVDNSTNGPNGLPVILNDVAGLDLTINGNGATIQRSTATPTPSFRILQISGGATVNCNGLIIRDGKATGNFPNSVGGGIFNFQSTLTLTNCVLRENTGLFGGGLYNNGGAVDVRSCLVEKNHGLGTSNNTGIGGGLFSLGGTLTLLASTVQGNTCDGGSAGLYSTGIVTIVDSSVVENVAASSGGGMEVSGQLTMLDSRLNENISEAGFGGAINVVGTATLQRCIINNNTTKALGGGAFYNQGTLTVESSNLLSNTAAGNGGAILAEVAGATTTVRGSTFSNNKSALRGGAIYNAVTLQLLNSTLSSNNAGLLGGGLYSFGAKNTVVSSTFDRNSAQGGGGIFGSVGGNSPDRFLTLRNCIFQKGVAGGNLLGSGNITSLGFNLSSDAAEGDTGTGQGGYLNAQGDIRNTSPNLGPLQYNGGPTLTHAPVFPSPAIDAGDDSIADLPTGLTTDQRGPGFPRRLGLHVDIGAVEVGINLTVTTIEDHDDGVCSATDCTLREAITASNAAGGGTVNFAPGVRGTIQLLGPLPDIRANLRLQGPGQDQLTVRRAGGPGYSVFVLRNLVADSGLAASISGLTIKDGQAQFGMFPTDSGGGILNDRGTLFVKDCTITGNRGCPATSSFGGGIFNYNGNLSVETSTIAGNGATRGGGIASFRDSAGANRVVLDASTISGNSCPGGQGGGVFNEVSGEGASAELRMFNCTLSGNSAGSTFFGSLGGGLFTGGESSGSSEVTLTGCTISGNSADAGGVIYNYNLGGVSLLNLRNNLLKTGASGGSLINSNGTIHSLGNNLCSDETGGPGGTGPGGYLNDPSDIRNTDPLIGPLQDNGGSTFTHALLPGSPAINAGSNVASPAIDQRGFLRLGLHDIGAFEFSGIQLRILNVARLGSDLVITFNGIAGRTFQLERKLSLTDLEWLSVPGIDYLTPASDGDAQFVDPSVLGSLSNAYYRVSLAIE